MKKLVFFASLFSLFSTALVGPSAAASTTAYVADFKVSGAPERGDLKDTLQVLLASRLNGDAVAVVGTAAGASIIVSSSYTQLGKIFSLDAMAKDNAGNVLVRAYEQGENQDELIPSINRLAQKLGAGLAKLQQQSLPSNPAMAAIQVPVTAETKAIPAAPAPSASTDIVRADASAMTVGASKNTSRLPGALSGIALGRTLDGGVREIFVVGENSLSLYHQGAELKQVAQVKLGGSEKVLGVDTADLDGDGTPEVYLTLLKGDNLASRVYVVSGDGMKKVAEDLPFYFRAFDLDGKGRKLYAQEMGTDADFYGDVHLVEKVNNTYNLKSPLKLPRFATIYNFNQFTDASGKKYTVVLHEDGYVLVYSDAGEEIWRSSDKFGGTEISFKRQGSTNARDISDQYRRTFLEQRMMVTSNNEIIIPKNGGFFVFGSNRSYKKNMVYAFAWNGATLDERWHTKESQNYLADYAYDSQRKELVLLEVVQKKGLLQNGASAIVVKKVD